MHAHSSSSSSRPSKLRLKLETGGIPRVLLLTIALLTPASGPAHSGVLQMPFRSVESMIVVEGKVNGNRATFLLDTGANRTILSAKSYGNLPFELRRTQRVGRGAGMIGESVRLHADVTLANHTWAGQPVTVMNLDDLTHELKIHVDGLLGQDLLREFRSVRIDYHAHVVELEE